MKHAAILLILLVALLTNVQAQNYQPVKLANTELRTLHSTIANRDYQLYIGYPDSYREHPERTYPVVYLTDAYWSFARLFPQGSGLWYDKLAPEYIVVGIGYAGENVNYDRERLFELSPTYQKYGWTAGMTCPMGGSRKFLDAIKTEIIPTVEKQFRADTTFRVLYGASMGGLFSLFAMYEEPGLFDGVISVSPVVEWDYFWLFRREAELRTKAVGDDYNGQFSIPTRLYMTVGGVEYRQFIANIKAFNEIICDSLYSNFSYEFRVIDGEGHSSNNAESFTRGIRFVFKK
jgi:predicted alpha/beta superfamily hydrolase